MQKIIERLSNKTTVDLITPQDERYESARLIYNRMHDCYPGLIVRTLDVDALRDVTAFAFKENLPLAIRGGGHHIGGFGTCNDGIVIDFSPFKHIQIDAENNIVSVAPGAHLADIDRVLCREGYVIPSGTISATGLAGLTLGGGIGWLIGKYGLTCDQLCGADVLLANGDLVRAEEEIHKDLLWALRGGGGNFGIVTRFRYHLNKLPVTVCGMGEVEWENAAEVMTKLVQFLHTACPPSLTVAPVFVKDKLGKPSLRIDFCCADGTDDDVSKIISLSDMIAWSNVREWTFPAWQKEFDATLSLPKRGYWKASYVESIAPGMIEQLCAAFDASPAGDCTIMIEHLHGAFKNYDLSVSAFPLRHTSFGLLFSARWVDPAEDQANISWVRQSFHAIDPNGTSQTYLNYTSADDMRAVQTLVSCTRSRIANVKMHYDPDNRFKRNHNVIPVYHDKVSGGV